MVKAGVVRVEGIGTRAGGSLSRWRWLGFGSHLNLGWLAQSWAKKLTAVCLLCVEAQVWGCTHLSMFSSTLALELFLINACTGPREMALLAGAQAEALCWDREAMCGKGGRREMVFWCQYKQHGISPPLPCALWVPPISILLSYILQTHMHTHNSLNWNAGLLFTNQRQPVTDWMEQVRHWSTFLSLYSSLPAKTPSVPLPAHSCPIPEVLSAPSRSRFALVYIFSHPELPLLLPSVLRSSNFSTESSGNLMITAWL